MWSKSSLPLNSLAANCIKKCCAVSDTVAGQGTGSSLPIHVRQRILDYLVRERITVGASFVCQLLEGGGVFSFDLWSLSDNNLYKPQDVTRILDTLSANCNNLCELSLGGSTWIYNNRVIRGPLKQLFARKLPKLTSLRIQQVSSPDELLSVCEACDNLNKLEISQPSLTDQDVARVEEALLGFRFASIRKNLRELKLPSTVKSGGILRLLAAFPRVQWLKVARFETMLETLEEVHELDSSPESAHFFKQLEKAGQVFRNLRGLTITHPLGCDTVDRLVDLCPLLEELTLEIQDGMLLQPIIRLNHLKRLELRNSPTLPASYLQQVLPVLEVIGSKLETLSIEQFDVVDLTSCARLCPNLSGLSAQWFTILGCNQVSTLGMNKASREALRRPFSELRYLRLRPRAQRAVHPEAVNFLLSHSHLIEHCELYCCYELTDDHITSIRETNQFVKLKNLILRHGHSVTKTGLNRLTTKSTDLQLLDCGRPLLSKAELVPNDDEPQDNLLNL